MEEGIEENSKEIVIKLQGRDNTEPHHSGSSRTGEDQGKSACIKERLCQPAKGDGRDKNHSAVSPAKTLQGTGIGRFRARNKFHFRPRECQVEMRYQTEQRKNRWK